MEQDRRIIAANRLGSNVSIVKKPRGQEEQQFGRNKNVAYLLSANQQTFGPFDSIKAEN